MKKIYLLPILVLLIGVQSCTKDRSNSSSQNPNLTPPPPKLNLIRSAAITPVVINGILKFTDETQFMGYMDYLDSLVVGDTITQADTLDIDQKLTIAESDFTYTSLRSVTHAAFEALNNIGWDDPQSIPDIHFISSATTRSVYNADGNVQIGNAINHLYNKDWSILIKDADPAMLDRVNNLPPGLDGVDLLAELGMEQSVEVYSTQSFSPLNDRLIYAKTTNDTNWLSGTMLYHKPPGVDCNNSNKMYDLYFMMVQQGISPSITYAAPGASLDVWVDWGDGHTETHYGLTIIKRTGGKVTWVKMPSTHTYTSGGTKVIQIKVKRPYHTTWVSETFCTVNIPLSDCNTWVRRETPWHYVWSSDNSAYLRGKVGTHLNFWGICVFDAESQSFIQQPSGKYRRRKVDKLQAEIWGAVGTDCISNVYSGGSYRSNDRATKVKLTKGMISEMDYSTINSRHRMKHNGIWTSFELQILRCE